MSDVSCTFPWFITDRLELNRAWMDNWRQLSDTFEPAFDYALEHGWIAAIYDPYCNYQLTKEGIAVASA